jgi:predicted ATPase/DNA-binding SARP family transcriptional activator
LPALLKVFLLGEFRVLQDGVPVAQWPRPATPRLLKLLALAPHLQLGCAALAERLWPGIRPGDGQERAQQRLHHQVYLLNQALGQAGRVAAVSQQTVRLLPQAHWWVDAAAFEQALEASIPASADTHTLAQALALYRGPLLPDDDFDETIATQRSYLAQRHLNGLYALSARYAHSGDGPAAIATLQRVLHAAPADEAAHLQLIEMYGRVGQLAQVEQQFADCKLALNQAFAAAPTQATLLAYQNALRGVRAAGLVLPAPTPTQMPTPALAATVVRFVAPAPVVQLIGREAWVASACAAVLSGSWRLHTLLGPGGVGKTQLVVRLAHELGSRFRHGACFVSLAEVRADAVLDQIARALGVAEQPHKHLQATVLDFLADKHLLLVLDNFEHVLPAAELVTPLLQRCALLTVVTTSRVRLNLAAEAVLDVPPLPAQASGQAAVQLFVRRATAVQPDFALTKANTADAVAIAQQLGGLPLALELAAARLPLYGMVALRQQLALDTGSVVAGGGADRPARHRSLDASMAWSYALLPPQQQRVLHRLARLIEPFDLTQAQGLCAGLASDVSQAVQALLEAGLLTRAAASTDGVAPRFGLLSLTQEFLLRHALGSDAAAADARAFVAFQLQQADHLEALLEQGQVADAMAAFDASRLGFFAALETAEQTGDGVSLTRLVHRLVRCWSRATVFSRAMPWVKRARGLAHLMPPAEQGWLLLMAGYFLVDHGEPAAGHACAGEAIALAHQLGDPTLDARASLLYSGTAAAVGTPEVGIAALVRTQAFALGAGDADMLHKASINLGVCHLQCGDLAAAQAQWQACDARLQNQRTPARVSTLFNLALAAHYRGEVAQAMRLLDLALELEHSGQPLPSRVLHIQLRRAWMHCCNRDVASASQALRAASDTAGRASLANAQQTLGFLQGKIDLAKGDVDSALNQLAGAAANRADHADPWDLLDSRLWLFHALWAQTHNRARARALLPTLQNMTQGWRQERPRALEALALALCDEGRLAQAADAWRAAQTQRQASGLQRFAVEQARAAEAQQTLSPYLRTA